jgi:hypothetical protein
VVLPGALPDLNTAGLEYEFPNAQVDPNAVAQGAAGDCVFLSSVIAALKSNAKDPFKIVQNNDKKHQPGWDYEVTFPGGPKETAGKPIKVTAPDQAQIALYSTAGQNGLWLSIIEKAYAKVRQYNLDNFPGAWFQRDAYDSLKGQFVSAGVQVVTGSTPVNLIADYGQPLVVAKVDYLLSHAIDPKGGKPTDTMKPMRATVVAGAGSNPDWLDTTKDQTQILPPHHAYAVIGYDTKNHIVQLQNPWNRSDYKYGTIFTLDLATFCARYDMLSVEQRP